MSVTIERERIRETIYRIPVNDKAQERNQLFEDRSLRVDRWMDDLNESYLSPQDETVDEENWIDDLDEAA